MKKIFPFARLLVLALSFSLPLLVSAQYGYGTTPPPSSSGGGGAVNTQYLDQYLGSIKTVINTDLVPVLIALAFIVFLWGVFKYFILGAADEKKREDGRKFVLWAVIGFVIIFSLWGLVAIVSSTLGLSAGPAPAAPTI